MVPADLARFTLLRDCVGGPPSCHTCVTDNTGVFWANFLTVVVLVVLVSSCGGAKNEDRLLRLPGEEVTESELRHQWHEQLAQAPAAAAVICDAIAGAEPDTVLSFFEVDVSSQDLTEAQRADLRRASVIIQEECAVLPDSQN